RSSLPPVSSRYALLKMVSAGGGEPPAEDATPGVVEPPGGGGAALGDWHNFTALLISLICDCSLFICAVRSAMELRTSETSLPMLSTFAVTPEMGVRRSLRARSTESLTLLLNTLTVVFALLAASSAFCAST